MITNTTAVPGNDAYDALSVIAFSGAAYSDDHQNRQLLFGGAATAPPADEGDALAFLLDEFAANVQSSVDPADSLGRWRQLAMIADAVERSAASQQAVTLELD